MKQFRFSLQTLHNMREQELEKAELALGQAASAVAVAAAQVSTAIRLRDEAIANYAKKLRKPKPDANDAMMYDKYIKTLESRINIAQEQLAAREQEHADKLHEAIKAKAAAEATTKLREQQFAHYCAEIARQEQDQLDELATIAAVRRMRETV